MGNGICSLRLPALLLLPVAVLRHRRTTAGGVNLQLTAVAGALSLGALCHRVGVHRRHPRHGAVLHDAVWSALLGRIVLKQRITVVRAVTMALALAGMLTMFGLGESSCRCRAIPATGWGSAAGLSWAVSAVRLRQDHANSALDLTVWSFLWCALLVTAGAGLAEAGAMPDLHTLWRPCLGSCRWRCSWSLPCGLASTWGPKHIDPALVGILFMTEITVGGITAALWAGEPFGRRELAGVLLISGAALIDSLWDFWQARSQLLVRSRGLEPPRCYPLAPQASASTNSATTALPGEWRGVSTRLRQIKWVRTPSPRSQ